MITYFNIIIRVIRSDVDSYFPAGTTIAQMRIYKVGQTEHLVCVFFFFCD